MARESVASRVQVPPAFCTEAKVAKGGAYLRDTTVQLVHNQLIIHAECLLVTVEILHVGSVHMQFNCKQLTCSIQKWSLPPFQSVVLVVLISNAKLC